MSPREGPDDGLPADAADDPQARGDLFPAAGDREPPAGQELPPLHVRGLRPALATARGGAAGTRARAGHRVATLAWNHYAHLEAYFGIPCAGMVLHTLNLRLHPNDLAYIATHAGDTAVIVDRSLLPLLEQFKDGRRSSTSSSSRTPTRSCSQAPIRTPIRLPTWTRTTRWRCATRAARPGCRRASSTRTARPCCTRSARRSPRRSACT